MDAVFRSTPCKAALKLLARDTVPRLIGDTIPSLIGDFAQHTLVCERWCHPEGGFSQRLKDLIIDHFIIRSPCSSPTSRGGISKIPVGESAVGSDA